MSREPLPPHPAMRSMRYALSAFVLIVSPPAITAQAEGKAITMDELAVTETALKVEAPLVETPRPASVVQREELEERNVQSLDDTFRYRAGVLSGHFGADNDTDWFKIRGYDQSTYQDGLRLYRDGFYQWLPEPFGLQRVELLKGPASILYGETPPGGVINAISKRPTREARGLLELQVGSNEHRQVGLDVSGPAAGNDDVRYRMVGLFRSGEGDIDFTENERYYIAPSMEWDITDDTELTLLASFQKDDAVPYNGFKLPYGTINDTPFGKVDPSTSYSEPSYDTNEREQSRIGYELRHWIDDTWRVEQRMRYSEVDLLLRSSYILAKIGPRTGSQGLTYRDGQIDSWTFDNRVVGTWSSDNLDNTLLLGVDYQDIEKQGEQANLFAFGTIDLFDPQYGRFTPPSDSQITDQHVTKDQLGLYVQNQLRIDDRWVLLAGIRHDRADTKNHVSGEEADVDETTLSAGVMYLAANGVNPYLSYTESFEPIAGTDPSGDLYDPIEGQQLELGVKYAPGYLDGYVTAAAYRIEEENTLVTAGAVQAQAGERNTDGFEVEGVAYLTDQLQATAAYTYSDSVTRNTATNADEVRAPLIPRHMASLWLDYTFAEAAPGLKIGGGVRYNGGSESESQDIEVPSYTVLDLMARYDLNQNWRVQFNVNNVTDEEYVASCDYWCYYGAARSFEASLGYRW